MDERIKKIEEFLLNPDRVMFETLEEVGEAIKSLQEKFADIDISELEQLEGKTPVFGVDYFTEEDMQAIEQFIFDRLPVSDVDFPSVDTVREFIQTELAKIPVIKGDKGEKGSAGKNGKDGKDGSPDTGEQIVKKLRDLPKNKKLKFSDVRGLENKINLLNENTDDIDKIKEAVSKLRVVVTQPNQSGGGQVDSVVGEDSVEVDSTDPVNPVVKLVGDQDTPGNSKYYGTDGTGTKGFHDIPTGGTVNWGDIGGTLSNQTDLQNALNAKANESTTISAGTGLTGGGDLSTNRTLALDASSIASLGLADSALQSGDNVSELTNDAGYTTNTGTVTSVGMSVPTGLSVAGSPVTSSGTLAVTYQAGYQGYTTSEASKLSGIETGAEVNTVTPTNAVELTGKKVVARVNSTASYSSAITPDFDDYDEYQATAQDDTVTLNLPTNLTVGNVMKITLEMAGTETFTPNGSYIFAEDNDAPATLETGYIYELIIHRGPNNKYLVTWTRYEV